MESTLTSYHALDQVLRKKETWAKVSGFLGGGGGGLGAGADAGLGERTLEIWGGGEQSYLPLALSPFCISIRPKPNHPHPAPNNFAAIHTSFTRSG